MAVCIIAAASVGIGTYLHFERKSTEAYKADVEVNTSKPSEDTLENEKPETSESLPVLPRLAEVTISSVGDCTIGTDSNFSFRGSYIDVFNKNNHDYKYFFKNVYQILSSDDLTTANLETTFTNETEKVTKKYNFKSSPDMAEVLKSGSVEAVNISNNHIMDYGPNGFKDTINTLKKNNIGYFGEGSKFITEIKGIKFGFLGYQVFQTSKAFRNKLKGDISDLKAQNCIVIINFHWGIEREYYPNSMQKEIAHFAVDNGADLIIGHHPHVVQGVEKYKDKLIAYSLGNFSFGGNSNPEDKDTFILQTNFKFEDEHLKSYGIKLIPCSISSVSYSNDYCPTPLEGDEKTALLSKLNKLSFNLGFTLSDNYSYINVSN